MPGTLSAWQRMFHTIYPNVDGGLAYGRFTEEMGELAEAMRVFPIAQGSFLSESADVFAWLMHLITARDLDLRNSQPAEPDIGSSIEEALFREYPDKCRECNSPVCVCPPILSRSVLRLAQEGPGFDAIEEFPFVSSREALHQFVAEGKELLIGIRS